MKIGNNPSRTKRHVLAWANSVDHTETMAEEDDTAGASEALLDGLSGDSRRPDSLSEFGVGPGNRPNNRPGGEAEIAVCDHPDCRETGQYRAPRSRQELHRFYWFCLEHVREYNAAWNYYADMDDAAGRGGNPQRYRLATAYLAAGHTPRRQRCAISRPAEPFGEKGRPIPAPTARPRFRCKT